MLTDYFILRRGNILLSDLFTLSPSGRYHYFHGFNLRAYAAFIVGFLLPLPGFIATFGHGIGAAAEDMFALGWVLSFLMGGISYWLICLVWKVPGKREEGELRFEEKVNEAEELIQLGLGLRNSSEEDRESQKGENREEVETRDKILRTKEGNKGVEKPMV